MKVGSNLVCNLSINIAIFVYGKIINLLLPDYNTIPMVFIYVLFIH